MTLLTISLVPVLIILVYVYFRDKYEKEPILMLLFIPYIVYLWRSGSIKMKKLSLESKANT